MSGSSDTVDDVDSVWGFCVGDLIRFAPSRRYWDYYYDSYYDGYGYPYAGSASETEDSRVGAIGIIVERYEKYGYHSKVYYKIKWMDKNIFSNEKHEDLELISSSRKPEKDQ